MLEAFNAPFKEPALIWVELTKITVYYRPAVRVESGTNRFLITPEDPVLGINISLSREWPADHE